MHMSRKSVQIQLAKGRKGVNAQFREEIPRQVVVTRWRSADSQRVERGRRTEESACGRGYMQGRSRGRQKLGRTSSTRVDDLCAA